jgi:serine phosphatase RsbU (regulator of sigma subunit)/ligand-binding sensor domain-containing protein
MTNHIFSRKGTWRTYTIADGLPDLRTEHLAEDRDGYLWIGTWDGGACRFDGEEFRTFTTRDGLSGNRVMAIHLDRQGRLWFGTWDGGVCFWDGKQFHRFDGSDGVSGKSITFIFEDREGRLWFAGAEALGYYDGAFHDLVPAYEQQHGLPPSPSSLYGECWGIAQDREGHLWFAFRNSNLVRYDGERFHRYGEEHGLPAGARTIAQNGDGDLWAGVGGNLYRYDGQTFHPVPVESKVPISQIRKIQCDRQGRTWLCTTGNGAFCHDGAQFHQVTPQDGLAYDWLNAVLQDREGNIWFATWGGGLSCYDPTSLQVLSEREGLPNNTVFHIAEDQQGHLWMGFTVGGPSEHSRTISRYDGEHLTALRVREDSGRVLALYVDARNRLWTGGNGLWQYDGQIFQKAEGGTGFERILVSAIAQDREGRLLFGHRQGGIAGFPRQITRFDGKTFQTLLTCKRAVRGTSITALIAARHGGLWFALGERVSFDAGEGIGYWREGENARYYTTQDGLVDNLVTDLLEDRHGHLWIATYGGLSRFDGRTFLNFTTEDGLPSNHVYGLCEDRQGHLWFGTDAGPVRYNGTAFQTLHAPEIGAVFDLLQDRQGKMWFGTNKGIVHYAPSTVPPKIRLQQVLADRTYAPDEAIQFSTSTRQVIFEYKGMSFRTHPEHMLYTYRLEGYDDWQQPTRQMRAFYRDLPPGEYAFQVKSIDRDLNESEPASVKLTVTLSTRDQKIDELERRVAERTRELEETHRQLEAAQARLIAELEEELQTAHEMQMRLMPKTPPQIQGFDIAGRCLPANHVGGDLFQYFLQDSTLSLCLADVTGHAMEAAVPVMMFSGILESEIHHRTTLEVLFSRLNHILHRKLDHRTFICFALGEIDTTTHILRLANSACPYPYHFSAAQGQIAELGAEGYPLGIRPDSTYAALERSLEGGDYVVFCSDGIAEAPNGAGELFGFERAAGVILQGCREGLSAEALVERILSQVKAFAGDKPQADDQTVVVVKVEDRSSSIGVTGAARE